MIFRYVPLRQWIWHAAAAAKTMFARWRYQRDMFQSTPPRGGATAECGGVRFEAEKIDDDHLRRG